MSPSLTNYLDLARIAATQLGDARTLDLLAIVSDQARARSLRLLIVGSIGAGRCSVANALLRTADLLPVSPIPKAPLSIELDYGEPAGAEVHTADNTTFPVPLSGLARLLDAGNPAAERYALVALHAPCALLAAVQIRIEALSARHSDAEWQALFATHDACLLVLNATALLSESERVFLRTRLQPQFGLERTVLVLNQMDAIPEDERDAVLARVRHFLGSFVSQPLLLPFSAAQARAALSAGQDVPTDGLDDLATLVERDLVARSETLRLQSVLQGSRACLAGIEASLARQQAELAVDNNELRADVAALDAHSDWFQQRIAQVCNRVRLYVGTLAKERLLREVEAFSATLQTQLPDELADSDLSVTRRHLPGYIETLWAQFLDQRLAAIRAALADELRQVAEQVENDVSAVLGPQAQGLLVWLDTLDDPAAGTRPVIAARRGKWVGPLAGSLLQTAGALLLLAGSGPIGLAALGTGQIVRMATRPAAETSRQQALIAATVQALPELERRIKEQLERRFEQLAEQIADDVGKVYQAQLAELRTYLQRCMEQRDQLQARRDTLDELVDFTLPALRAQLATLSGEEVQA